MTNILTVTPNPAIDVATYAAKVVPTHKIRCTSVTRDPGGGGINAARVIARLGGTCDALFPVGGPLGELLRRLVEAENVNSLCIGIAEDTRESFTVCETDSGQEYRFVLPGPELSETEWQALLQAATDHGSGWIVASGSLPPGVPVDFYARLSEEARARGARVFLDSSGKALAAAIEAGTTALKPNLRELREFTGKPLEDEDSWVAAARDLVDTRAAEIVALSLGHHGALLATQAGTWRAPGLPVRAKSAVGAGDSFVGAMVYALEQGGEPTEAFRKGVAAGTAALLTAGTALCNPENVERLLPQVELRAL